MPCLVHVVCSLLDFCLFIDLNVLPANLALFAKMNKALFYLHLCQHLLPDRIFHHAMEAAGSPEWH